jgi:exopolyphosphatase/pppGpp-phosphohydrolase
VPGLNPARADIIVAGLSVAAEVLARFDPRDLLVSGYGIREGILLEAARVQLTVADPGAARERSVRQFAERCHYEEPHAHQVRKLALQLFDALSAPAARRHGSADSGRRGAAARCGLPHQLREASQALVPPHLARRVAGHDARGTGGDCPRGALSPRPLPSARTGPLRSSIVPCARAS